MNVQKVVSFPQYTGTPNKEDVFGNRKMLQQYKNSLPMRSFFVTFE
jgi:hypothetical protein